MENSSLIAYKFRPGLKDATLAGEVATDNTASIFQDQALFFNSISAYNDPFESQFVCPEKPDRSSHAFRSVLYRVISGIGLSASHVSMFLGNPLARWFMYEIAQNEQEHALIVIELEIEYRKYMSRIGTLCLNQSYNDILSWSHYAESHQGIAIGFDAEKLYQTRENYHPIQKEGDSCDLNCNKLKKGIYVTGTPIPITYVSAPIPIDIMSFAPNDFVKLGLSTKSVHWSYERELRYLAFPGRNVRSYDDVIHLIRKPFLEKRGVDSNLGIHMKGGELGIVNGREVNLMDQQDQALLDSFRQFSEYPLRRVYHQITNLMISSDTVAGSSIPFENPAALKEVIFGSKMNKELVERHIQWIKKLGQYNHVKFYKMDPCRERFEIQRWDV